MNYQIVATLGPASSEIESWSSMLQSGVSGFRLNTSHLSVNQLPDWIDNLTQIGRPDIPLILDLQGSKWRLGMFSEFELRAGQIVILVHAADEEKANTLPVPHADFFGAAALSNGIIILNDAKSRLQIERLESGRIEARVIQGGWIASRKGITFESTGYRQESLPEKDQQIIAQTRHLDYIRYAVSYIRDAQEMAHYRRSIGAGAYLIAKLERGAAVAEAPAIAEIADELWLCRGDLGAEIGLAAMARTVTQFSRIVAQLKRPVYLAGQLLEHMTHFPNPTRSELCYIYEAIHYGYAGIVLSDETAIGKYPLESCRMAALFQKQAELRNG